MPRLQINCKCSLTLSSTSQVREGWMNMSQMTHFKFKVIQHLLARWKKIVALKQAHLVQHAIHKSCALINVARRLVEVAQHGDQAVAPTVGAADVGATGANVGNLRWDAYPAGNHLGKSDGNASSKWGCCLNPKGWCIWTPNIIHSTTHWKIQVLLHS